MPCYYDQSYNQGQKTEPDGWIDRMGTGEEATVAEAILDRIRPNSYEILIEGNVSMRERHGIKAKKGVNSNDR